MLRGDVRIALVTTSYPSSHDDPAGHFVAAETRALVEEGHDVEVVTPRVGGAFGWPGVAARVRERPGRALEIPGFLRHARAILARGCFDRVVAHWAVPSALPIALSTGAPLEVVSHGGDVRLLLALPSPLRAHIVSRIASRAELWRFVSRSLLDALERSLPPDLLDRLASVAEVRPPRLELPEVTNEEIRARKTSFGALYVSVGRLVHAKRVDRVLAHVAARRAAGEPAELVVVGDGPERAPLTRLAARLVVPARFVGKTSHREALAWIAAADALAFASEAEGLSTVVREAEALGTRVVHV